MISKQPVTQVFLDSAQYLTRSILQYQHVYGVDFVSPGGQQMATELIAGMRLEPGSQVLDVGCGLGGSAFTMARDFGLRVDGIDLSKNMIALANQKLVAHGLSGQVELRWGDCLKLDRQRYYDAVYSRDVFLHIHDKTRLFTVLNRCLKERGSLLFTDYCCGPRPWRDDFRDYVEQRGYCLHSVDEYQELIAKAGFRQVTAISLNDRFAEILQADLARIDDLDLDSGSRAKLRDSWRKKLARTESGDHCWALFSAIRGNIHA